MKTFLIHLDKLLPADICYVLFYNIFVNSY